MKITILTGICAAAVSLYFPAKAAAFECPKHIKAAQESIDKVTEDMKGMEKMMSKEDMALVHALWDDSKMLLEGAKHNHEKPQGDYDHARSIAKAKAALGYAQAADILHFRYMKRKK